MNGKDIQRKDRSNGRPYKGVNTLGRNSCQGGKNKAYKLHLEQNGGDKISYEQQRLIDKLAREKVEKLEMKTKMKQEAIALNKEYDMGDINEEVYLGVTKKEQKQYIKELFKPPYSWIINDDNIRVYKNKLSLQDYLRRQATQEEIDENDRLIQSMVDVFISKLIIEKQENYQAKLLLDNDIAVNDIDVNDIAVNDNDIDVNDIDVNDIDDNAIAVNDIAVNDNAIDDNDVDGNVNNNLNNNIDEPLLNSINNFNLYINDSQDEVVKEDDVHNIIDKDPIIKATIDNSTIFHTLIENLTSSNI